MEAPGIEPGKNVANAGEDEDLWGAKGASNLLKTEANYAEHGGRTIAADDWDQELKSHLKRVREGLAEELESLQLEARTSRYERKWVI